MVEFLRQVNLAGVVGYGGLEQLDALGMWYLRGRGLRMVPCVGYSMCVFHVNGNLPECESGVALALSSNPGSALPALCIDP